MPPVTASRTIAAPPPGEYPALAGMRIDHLPAAGRLLPERRPGVAPMSGGAPA